MLITSNGITPTGLANCLDVLAQRLVHLLPVCPNGTVCARALPVVQEDGKYIVHLPELPEFNTLTLYSANGSVITLNATDGPTINYVTGQIIFPTNPGPSVVVDYQISLAEEFIRQSVMDLGRRLPRKQTTQLLTQDTGVTPLPEGLSRILSLCRVECGCTCHETSCPELCGQAPCFQCHHCATYIDAGYLIQAAGPCKIEQFDICYLAGYPLDKYGCFVGLTPDLADLILYKAQSLAYRSPQMLMAISGLSINSSNNSNSSSDNSSGSGNSSNTETTTTIKTKDNCGKEEKTVTTKTGSATSSQYSSSTASALSSLFSSKTNSGLADQYETLYLAALNRRTNLAALRLHPQRSGYRARFAAHC